MAGDPEETGLVSVVPPRMLWKVRYEAGVGNEMERALAEPGICTWRVIEVVTGVVGESAAALGNTTESTGRVGFMREVPCTRIVSCSKKLKLLDLRVSKNRGPTIDPK